MCRPDGGHGAIRKLVGAYKSTRHSARAIPGFVRDYGIPMEEFEPEQYASFNDFFIRRFRAGARRFCKEPREFSAFAEGRYLAYREVMKSGEPAKISRLLRELFMLDKMDELKGKEKEIMEQAKKFLVDEIAFIREELASIILEEVHECLETMYRKKVDKDKIARAKRRAALMGEEVEEAKPE